jgi:hypothetical protein
MKRPLRGDHRAGGRSRNRQRLVVGGAKFHDMLCALGPGSARTALAAAAEQ